MATRTIARLFDSYADASAAVRDLEAAGFSPDDVSLIANRDAATADRTEEGGTTSGAGTGATLGGLVGGGAGLLAGIGALAIPGFGPVVAVGWLTAGFRALLPWWSIVVANAAAAGVAGAWLLHRHPGVGHRMLHSGALA